MIIFFFANSQYISYIIIHILKRYNVWRLTADISYIQEKTCVDYIPTPKPTRHPINADPFNRSSPTSQPTQAPNEFETKLKFEWDNEYTQFFPIFENYKTTSSQNWIHNTTGEPLEIIWNNNHSLPFYYNFILLKEDAEYINCFYYNNKSDTNWHKGITSYFGCEYDECIINGTNITYSYNDTILDIDVLKQSIKILIKLKGVGVATASLILAIYTKNVPFMADEVYSLCIIFCFVCNSEMKLNNKYKQQII